MNKNQWNINTLLKSKIIIIIRKRWTIYLLNSFKYPALSAELPMKWTNMKASGYLVRLLSAQLATSADFPQPI